MRKHLHDPPTGAESVNFVNMYLTKLAASAKNDNAGALGIRHLR